MQYAAIIYYDYNANVQNLHSCLMYSIQIYLHNLLTSAVGLFSGTKSPKKLIQAGFNN